MERQRQIVKVMIEKEEKMEKCQTAWQLKTNKIMNANHLESRQSTNFKEKMRHENKKSK